MQAQAPVDLRRALTKITPPTRRRNRAPWVRVTRQDGRITEGWLVATERQAVTIVRPFRPMPISVAAGDIRALDLRIADRVRAWLIAGVALALIAVIPFLYTRWVVWQGGPPTALMMWVGIAVPGIAYLAREPLRRWLTRWTSVYRTKA
jgi:hypothetical protein